MADITKIEPVLTSLAAHFTFVLINVLYISSSTALGTRGVKWHFFVLYYLYILVQYSEASQLHCQSTLVTLLCVVVDPFPVMCQFHFWSHFSIFRESALH